MKNLFLCLLLLGIISISPSAIAKNDDPIQSTQGIELNQNIEKSKEPKDIKNEQKQRKNRFKKYIKNKKQIEKQEHKKRIKQKELEYLEKRLESKKIKLDSLSSDQVKGEME